MLFSAYDAIAAAAGRVEEALSAAGARPEDRTETPPAETVTREEMQTACDEAFRKVEHLTLTLRGTGEARSHAESALADLSDAMDILSGKVHPKENPAPYEGT